MAESRDIRNSGSAGGSSWAAMLDHLCRFRPLVVADLAVYPADSEAAVALRDMLRAIDAVLCPSAPVTQKRRLRHPGLRGLAGAQYRRAFYGNRVAVGHCRNCGVLRGPGQEKRIMCAACAEKEKARLVRYRARQRAASMPAETTVP